MTDSSNHKRVTEMCRKLRDSGHRMTPRRLCILRALVEVNSHPSAEEIHAQVRRVSPMTSLATVYKTLETLPQAHPHIVCTCCGQIEDVEGERLDADLNAILTWVGDASGYQITAPRVEFHGLCRACRQEQQQKD